MNGGVFISRGNANFLSLFVTIFFFGGAVAWAQPPQTDPHQVLGYKRCASCHLNEQQVWANTPHARTFQELHQKDRAKVIARKMGLRSIKRGNVCLNCHYTSQHQNGRTKIISGVSCESCHGAAKKWVSIHNDYGGPGQNRQTESPEHKKARREAAISLGMRNPSNIYLIARSCFQCHSVPNEKLVNVGGHQAGSDFELVSWSQGIMRHNFARTDFQSNAQSTPDQLRVMFVAGLIADLEFSTRATGLATEKSKYGIAVAKRAVTVALKLKKIQDKVKDPNIQKALQAFASAGDLRSNQKERMDAVADQIQKAGVRFTTSAKGSALTSVDGMIPGKNQYR